VFQPNVFVKEIPATFVYVNPIISIIFEASIHINQKIESMNLFIQPLKLNNTKK